MLQKLKRWLDRLQQMIVTLSVDMIKQNWHNVEVMVHKSYVPTHVNNQIFFLLMVLFVMPRYIKLKSVIQFVVLGVP